jgi:hypothetical protein
MRTGITEFRFLSSEDVETFLSSVINLSGVNPETLDKVTTELAGLFFDVQQF